MTKKITILFSFFFILITTTSFAARIPNLNLLTAPVEQWHEISHSQLNTSSSTLYIGDNYITTVDPVEDILIIAVEWKEVITTQSKWKTDSPDTIIRSGQTHFKIIPPAKDEKGKYSTQPKLLATRSALPVQIIKNGVKQYDNATPSSFYFRWIPTPTTDSVLPPLLEWWYKNEFLKEQN